MHFNEGHVKEIIALPVPREQKQTRTKGDHLVVWSEDKAGHTILCAYIYVP